MVWAQIIGNDLFGPWYCHYSTSWLVHGTSLWSVMFGPWYFIKMIFAAIIEFL